MLSDIRDEIERYQRELKQKGNQYSIDDVIDILDDILSTVDTVQGKVEEQINDLESERDYYMERYHEEIGC